MTRLRFPIRSRWVFLVLVLLLTGLTASRANAADDAAHAPRPKLAVLVYFDQLRGDYLERWRPLFDKGGFRRLMDDGAWLQNCHYSYALTYTAPGHASTAAGCAPERHGIVSNEWRERSENKTVASVTPLLQDKGGLSPKRLLSPTIGDALKSATKGSGRVVSLSIKDRSAILPAGQKPDACYWFDSSAKSFVTSPYYRLQPHDWVEAYNREKPAERWAGQVWTRLRPDLDYARLSGPDDVVGERDTAILKRTFPHSLGGKPDGSEPVNAEALYHSPFGNDLLLGLVKRAIVAEGLGTRDVPDLLCVSFSSNDAIGHAWGPDSQEVLDVTLRSDLIVKELLNHLDAQVGAGRYALVLTSDHGVCPLPEVSRALSRTAVRVDPGLLGAKSEAFLVGRFGAADPDNAKIKWLEATEPSGIYLNQIVIRNRGLTPSAVETALADWLKTRDGIQDVFTRSQLRNDDLPQGSIARSARKSFHPDRSGDVIAILKPHSLYAAATATGTSHGTPHSYDTHVPVLVYGGGVRKGPRPELTDPQAVASILAELLGIAPPADAVVPVPAGLF